MILPSHSSWGNNGDFLGKCLGLYEADLHDSLSKAALREPEAVINVGCAEGYYAVGLAILMPSAIVYAFDIDPAAREICQQAAVDNRVSERLHVRGLCTPETLSDIISRYNRLFIMLDCEGAELQLVDPSKVAELSRCDLLIELHDFVVPGVTEKLSARLRTSHQLISISQGGRNPNLEQLSIYTEDDRWLMVSEQRPTIMSWLACWAQSSAM
jgi:hypothetical protein